MLRNSKQSLTIVADDMLFTLLLLVLVAVTSFGLGRLAERSYTNTNASVTPDAAAVIFSEPATQPQSPVVASRNGTKYHFPWCSGAARILPENTVYFDSAADAQAAGYEPAANCPDLE